MPTTRLDLDGLSLAVSGRVVRTAAIADEAWRSMEAFDAGACLRALPAARCRVDLFTFPQTLLDRTPRHPYWMEWESVAAIPLTTVDDWWRELPWKSRNNARRATRRGVGARIAPFDDDLIHGIVAINNAAEVRQGRRFSHFREPFEVVKRAHGTYQDRSTFVGAYADDELIGYAKIVRVGAVAAIMQFLVTPSHHDKRPASALMRTTVEHAVSTGAAFLRFGAYRYGNKRSSSLVEFKRRLGFEDLPVPRYFVPLTSTGRVALRVGLHRPLIGIVPAVLIEPLLEARRAWSRVGLFASTRPARR